MKLYIENNRFELRENAVIAITKQYNTLFSLSDRQTNFTNSFVLPDTAINVKYLNELGVIGNNSTAPYRVLRADLYDDMGECIIYNGRALIRGKGKGGYNVTIYDGSIDIFKAIENKTVGQLPMIELNHTKNIQNIISSWDNNLKYKYIVADYNGKTTLDANTLNADYITPSVSIRYIWDMIHQFYGFEYEGSFADSEEFNTTYITYPKGVLTTTPDELIFSSTDVRTRPELLSIPNNGTLPQRRSQILEYWNNPVNNLYQLIGYRHMKPSQPGNYRIEVSGEIVGMGYFKSAFNTSTGSVANLLTYPVECELWLVKNSHAQNDPDYMIPVQLLQSGLGSDVSFNVHGNINVNTVIELQPNETLGLILRAKNPNQYVRSLHFVRQYTPINVKLSKVDYTELDFGDAFIDLKITDFFKEILNRFAITPYKDKYTNKIKYLTIGEIINSNKVVDWSNKFPERESELYVYESYAKKNTFKYKYNEDNQDHNDGSIYVNNENLAEESTAYESQLYSPDKVRVGIFERPVNVYRMFNKDVRDDGSISYKALDKRYYFIRYQNIQLTGKYLKSEQTGAIQPISTVPFEQFTDLSYKDVVQDKYRLLGALINSSNVSTNKFLLSGIDVYDFDFTSLVYVKQFGGYFLVNRIKDFVEGKKTTVELVKMNYSEPESLTQDGINDIFVMLNPAINLAFVYVMLPSYLIVESQNGSPVNMNCQLDGVNQPVSYEPDYHRFVFYMPMDSGQQHVFKITTNEGAVFEREFNQITNVI